MTSKKQITANQKNALKGGVKTVQGKELVKYNATRHGILRDSLNKHELGVYDIIMKRHFQEFQPQTLIEEILIHQLTFNQMQLFRCQNEKNKLFYIDSNGERWDQEYFFKFDNGSLKGGKFEILNRYETNIENRIYRALNQLERIRRIKQGEVIPAPISFDLNKG